MARPTSALQVRVELMKTTPPLPRFGFVQTASTAPPGDDRPTALTFRKPLYNPSKPGSSAMSRNTSAPAARKPAAFPCGA